MGAAKQDMLEREDELRVVEEIAVRAGLLKRCPFHGEVYDPLNWDYESAYRLGNSLITKGDELVDLFDGNRREMTDLIKDLCSEYGDSCGACGAD